jgi:hypothetical protein
MKESVKINSTLLGKVRREAKKRGQTISGFLEVAALQSIAPLYNHHDNSTEFEKFLEREGIKYSPNGGFTTLIGCHDPIGVGVKFGIYKAQNDPAYKK